jgi:hypothetical protein
VNSEGAKNARAPTIREIDAESSAAFCQASIKRSFLRAHWSPNAKHREDPGEVLREAISDSREGRHELALLKHLWFHRHAIEICSSLSGVRRSYALAAWKDLCKKHEPARAALLRVRNATARLVEKDRDPWHAFHDLASINHYLEDDEHTIALFCQLHRRTPKRAKQVYNLVEPLLVRRGEYKLCGEYLEPTDRFKTIRKGYRVNLRLSKDPSIGLDYVQFAQTSFAEKAIRLIALLSLNGRVAEAKRIADRARRVWDNKEFRKHLAAAEKGKFATCPPPTPSRKREGAQKLGRVDPGRRLEDSPLPWAIIMSSLQDFGLRTPSVNNVCLASVRKWKCCV